VTLDLRTIYAIASLTCFVVGAIQLLAFATGRFERWPGWWGASNLLIGVGSMVVTLRGMIPDFISIHIGNLLMVAGYMLMLIGVRVFAGKPAQWKLFAGALLCAVPPILLLWPGPAESQMRIALLSLLLGVFDAAIARESILLARRENLLSAWIAIGLFVPTALLFAVRSALSMAGDLGGQDIFASDNTSHTLLALAASTFITLRGMALLLLAVERGSQRLIRQAHCDALTGALNRNGLRRAVERLQARAGREDGVSLLLIDIDCFKALNDTHGHATGDAVLCLLAESGRRRLRPGDRLARLGGDEFVIVMPGLPLAEAIAAADRVRSDFAEAVAALPGLRLWLTLSIGAADGSLVGEGLEPILQRADEALYRSKRQGRDRVQSTLAPVKKAGKKCTAQAAA